MLEKDKGLLVLDDSTLDKPYAQKIPLVYRHGSGKHHDIVKGINLLTLLWTDGDKHVPCDHRIYDKAHDNLSKNDHFASLVKAAHARGFNPAISDKGCVVHLMGYGFVKVFRTIATNGDAEHWASSNLNMTELERVATAEKTWAIKNYLNSSVV